MNTSLTFQRLRVTSLTIASLFVILMRCTMHIGGVPVNKACSYEQTDLFSCAGTLFQKLQSSSANLLSFCREVREASECMDTKTCAGNTTDVPTAGWFGLKDGLSFACSNEKEYQQYEVCLSDNATSNFLNVCNEPIRNRGTSPSEQEDCILINDVLKCVWTSLTAKCGEDAARFVHEVTRRTYKPVFAKGQCVIEEVAKKQSTDTSLGSSVHQISSLLNTLIVPLLSFVLTVWYKLV